MHALLGEFERHHERMIVRARERRAAVELTNLVDAGRVKTSVSEDDLLGKRLPRDEFVGDTNFRTLKALLKKVDERGFERSAHQLGDLASVFERTVSPPLLFSDAPARRPEFHEYFFKASARVMYKDDWGVQKPAIMQKHGWESCPGEVLISTPRRFGKTFSIAIFCACFLLTQKAEIVVFRCALGQPRARVAASARLTHESGSTAYSPARRASRKLLERVIE